MISIYGIQDPRNNEIRYVGQTVRPLRQRLNAHISNSRKPKTKKESWIRSIILAGLRPEMNLLAEACCIECANHLEKQYIKYYKDRNKLLNLSDGGRECMVYSAEVKEKQRKKRKEFWKDPIKSAEQTRLQMEGKAPIRQYLSELYSENIKKFMHSKEAREKAVKSIKVALNTPEYKEYRSAETKKMWESLTDETRENRIKVFNSAGRKKLQAIGHSTSESNMAHINKLALEIKKKRAKPFVGYKDGETIGEWENKYDAARELGLWPTNICAVLRGKAKTSKGYTFKYKAA